MYGTACFILPDMTKAEFSDTTGQTSGNQALAQLFLKQSKKKYVKPS
jgi:hypothetical protein